jgi:hypothetical protein
LYTPRTHPVFEGVNKADPFYNGPGPSPKPDIFAPNWYILEKHEKTGVSPGKNAK